MAKICPCKDCVAPKRYPGCHAACKEYKEWNEEHQQEKAQLREVRHNERVVDPRITWNKRRTSKWEH